MAPDYEADGVRLYRGDSLAVLPTLATGSADAVVTDPPYNLNFMSLAWDGGGVAFRPATWEAVLRVTKPGGYLLAFGGTRTWHRLACAVEDAGWEIRDTLLWLHGQGMPKSKATLKPAWEPVLLARKPGPRVLPLNVEECRVGTGADKGEWPVTARAVHQSAYNASRDGSRAAPAVTDRTAGRWPPNVALQHHDSCRQVGVRRVPGNGRRDKGERHGAVYGGGKGPSGPGGPRGIADADGMEAVEVWECHPTLCPVALLDAQAGERKGDRPGRKPRVACTALGLMNDDGWRPQPTETAGYSDSGGPSRFLYCAKASKADRGEGNRHPCVKSQALMRWLVSLVSFPGDTVLDPFMGSGTTGLACLQTGRRFVGVELDPAYYEIARKRLAGAHGPLFAPREVTA
jgi:hypothetical protein